MKAPCRIVFGFPLVPLLIHLHLVLLLPLLSLPFTVLPVSEDPPWIEFGHEARHLMTGKVRTGQM